MGQATMIAEVMRVTFLRPILRERLTGGGI